MGFVRDGGGGESVNELEPISMKLAYYIRKNLAANPENLVNVALATLPRLFGIFAFDFFAFTTALSLR